MKQESMGGKSLLPTMAVTGLLLTSAGFALSQNWTLSNAPLTNWTSIASSADGSRLVAAAWGFSSFGGGWRGPIYTSTNSGISWTPALPTNRIAWPFLDVNWWSVASSADGIRLFAVGWPPGDAIYPVPMVISTDAGGTWTNTGAFSGIWHSVATSGDGSKLAAAESIGDYHLHLSTDSGATWSQVSVTNAQHAAWSADGKTLVAAGNILAVSTNGGATWLYGNFTNVYWSAVASSADGARLVAMAYASYDGAGNQFPGLIYTSANSGATSAPSYHWQAVASSADGSKFVAVALNGPIFTSTDFGATWTSNNVPSLRWASVASSADGGRLFAVEADGGIYTSQSTLTPDLRITLSGDSLLISWLVPSSSFVLQENSDLISPTWTEVATPPTLNLLNLHNEVTVPRPGSTRFYRLKAI